MSLQIYLVIYFLSYQLVISYPCLHLKNRKSNFALCFAWANNGPLSQRHDVSLGCSWRGRPPYMESKR